MRTVSVILPVRNKSPYAKGAFDSLKEKTANHGDVEVWVGYDERDPEMGEFIKQYAGLITGVPIDMRMSIDGVGVYTNKLLEKTSGSIVWWMAEDIRIKTYGWDQVVKNYALLYGWRVQHFTPMCESGGDAFLALSRKWLNTTRHWSDHSRIDSWNSVICDSLPPERVRMHMYGFEIYDVTRKNKRKLKNPKAPAEFNNHPHLIPFENKIVQNKIKGDIVKLKRAIRDEHINN